MVPVRCKEARIPSQTMCARDVYILGTSLAPHRMRGAAVGAVCFGGALQRCHRGGFAVPQLNGASIQGGDGGARPGTNTMETRVQVGRAGGLQRIWWVIKSVSLMRHEAGRWLAKLIAAARCLAATGSRRCLRRSGEGIAPSVDQATGRASAGAPEPWRLLT